MQLMHAALRMAGFRAGCQLVNVFALALFSCTLLQSSHLNFLALRPNILFSIPGQIVALEVHVVFVEMSGAQFSHLTAKSYPSKGSGNWKMFLFFF
jgi:hypothetical protein